MATDEEQLVLSISADTRQILRAMKRLEGDIAKSSAGIEKKFASVGKGIDKAMTTGMQDRINKMVGMQTEATKEWTGALANQGKEMERLRARFNPMFSTVTRYKSAIGEIRAAHRLGAISSDEMAAAMQRERRAALSSIAAIKGRNAALADTPPIMGLGKGASSFNTANIAAQFQDIAVMAQMGIANPMTIALQQGTQLAAVLNQMGGHRDVIRGIGAAFLSIINPVSLVTVGTIAAGVAAYNYFSETEDGAEATEKALKAQADLIQRVAQAWGDVLPAIRAVAAERERLAGQEDIEKSTQQEIARVFKEIGQEVSSAGDQVTDLMDVLRNMAPPEQLVAWQSALRAVSASASENKTTIEEMEAAHKTAIDLFASTGIPVFQETADAIAGLIPELAAVNEQVRALEQRKAGTLAINNLQAAIVGISSTKARGELDSLLKKIREGEIATADLLAELARISEYAPDVSGIIGAFRAVAEEIEAAAKAAAAFTGKASQGGRTRYGGVGFMPLPDTAPTPERRIDPFFLPPDPKGGGRSNQISEAERARKVIDDVIASLKFEQEQLGRTGTAQRIYNELKRAGVDITSEAGRKIAEMVTAIEMERQALEESKRAMDARNQSVEYLFQIGSDAISEIIDKSTSAEDAVKKLAVQLALAAAQAALLGSGPLAGIIPGIFGGGGFVDGAGGGFAGLIGYSASAAASPIPLPVMQRPVMPVAGAAAQAITLHVIGEEGPMFRPTIRAESQGVAVKVTQAGFREFSRTGGRDMAISAVRDPRSRG